MEAILLRTIILLMLATLVLADGASFLLQKQWATYKAKYGKRYRTESDEAAAFKAFFKNKQEIDRFNAEESEKAGYMKTLDRFSDLYDYERPWYETRLRDFEEFLKLVADDPKYSYLADIMTSDEPLPAEVDWRYDDRVTPVKDQRQCGACWAFSTVGLFEGQQKVVLNTRYPIDLSVQQLVDCQARMGCNGGQAMNAANWSVNNAGLMAWNDYPYSAMKGDVCHFDQSRVVMRPKRWAALPKEDEHVLQKVVAKYGPVAVSIDATNDLFKSYKGGVYSDEYCGGATSHGVLLVGYGTDPVEGDYWIIKNSWGTDWGEAGYMRMKRGIDICSISLKAVIATF